jgi:hypothetical protein
MKLLVLLSSLLFTALFVPLANAGVEETSRETDTHIIHFNLFNSSMLSPEIAKQYNLKRSKYYAILNISVQEKDEQGNKSVPVLLQGTASNIVQQQRKLEFKQIDEGDAIYYLSVFRISNDDLLTFDIKIRTTADSPGYDLSFKRRVYVEL